MNSNTTSAQYLFSLTFIQEPLEIRADGTEEQVHGHLKSDGSVNVEGQTFESIDQAMHALPREANSTSNAWQFWSFYSEERKAWTPLEHLRAQLETKQQPNEVKTSITHPLRIDDVSVPGAKGKIGLTFCPGKICDGLYGGRWERDLNADIDAISSWGGKTLITLMENHEFDILGVPHFPTILTESDLEWMHLPIKDMEIPDHNFEKTWEEKKHYLYEKLQQGESIVIHCRGGLGRTGLLAARILTEWGIDPVDSVRRIRTARVNSIETYSQERYVLTQAWKNSP